MTCQICGKYEQRRLNSKYCKTCADIRRFKPISTLTAKQRTLALGMIGRSTRKDMAKTIGCSEANLGRFAREQGLRFRHNKYSQDTIEMVQAHYQQNSMANTQQEFPDASVQYIITRYGCGPRVIRPRYKNEDIIKSAAIAGAVSSKELAAHVNRASVKGTSIRELWRRHVKIPMSDIHGISIHKAAFLFTPDVPVIFLPTRGINRPYSKIVLWSEAPAYLAKDIPKSLVDAFCAMADFQNWMFRGKNPRDCLLDTMRRSRDGEPLG